MVAILEPLTECAVVKAREVMNALSIPNPPQLKNPNGRLANLTQDYIITHEVIPMMEFGPECERGHNLRVAMYGINTSRNLNFGTAGYWLNFLVGIAHDRGKLKFRSFYDSIGKDSSVCEKVKLGHISHINVPLEYGLIVASAIEQHHFWQRIVSKPYPNKPLLPQTNEGELLSKLVAVPDLFDALSTRPDRQTGQMRSYEEALKLTLDVYGDIRIKYEGNIFPKLDISGKELLTAMLS